MDMMATDMTRSLRSKAAAALLAALLAGCAAPGSQDGRYRDTGVPLSVTTRSAPGLMEGEWKVRAAFPADRDLEAVHHLAEWRGGPAFELVRKSCEDNGDCEVAGEIWQADKLGLNRWRIHSPHGNDQRELWVIWVDEGYRTAAIGEPDGGYAWVLDRSATGGEDRIAAAREILDFNGYDTTALVAR